MMYGRIFSPSLTRSLSEREQSKLKQKKSLLSLTEQEALFDVTRSCCCCCCCVFIITFFILCHVWMAIKAEFDDVNIHLRKVYFVEHRHVYIGKKYDIIRDIFTRLARLSLQMMWCGSWNVENENSSTEALELNNVYSSSTGIALQQIPPCWYASINISSSVLLIVKRFALTADWYTLCVPKRKGWIHTHVRWSLGYCGREAWGCKQEIHI